MKKKGNIMEEEINEIQLIHALGAMRHLDIITDTDVKYFIASNGNKITQRFYDDVIKTEGAFYNMQKLIYEKGYTLIIREVSSITLMEISLLAEGRIGVDDVNKHLVVIPTYGKYADLKIRPKRKAIRKKDEKRN